MAHLADGRCRGVPKCQADDTIGSFGGSDSFQVPIQVCPFPRHHLLPVVPSLKHFPLNFSDS
jgi:hypothetical protein